MSSKPWMKFYPQDWRADEKLRLCSLAARGLWLEVIALMHRSERYGHLLIGDKPPSPEQIAVQVGAPVGEVLRLLDELRKAGVYSVSTRGVISSRRMIQDDIKASLARQNGKNGGNPSLRKDKGNPPSDKGRVKGGLKLRGQRPDSSTEVEGGQPPRDLAKEVFDKGVSLLTSKGTSASTARSLIGKWRKQAGDGTVSELIAQAIERNISDPAPWITAGLSRAANDTSNFYASIDRTFGRGGNA